MDDEEIIQQNLKLLFDLDNLLADIEEPKYQKIGFQVESEAGTALVRARNDLIKKLPRELAQTYERLKKRYHQAIAPVERNFCLGCFQQLPTEYSTKHEQITTCPNCGRLLYWRIK